jgi:hypothetical protein
MIKSAIKDFDVRLRSLGATPPFAKGREFGGGLYEPGGFFKGSS